MKVTTKLRSGYSLAAERRQEEARQLELPLPAATDETSLGLKTGHSVLAILE